MKIPNPRLVRLAGLTRGAIIEQGDAELVVPPYLQPVVRLGAPVDKSNPTLPIGAGPPFQEESFLYSTAVAQVGVNAGGSFDAATLARGSWEMDFHAVFFFVGTGNGLNQSLVYIIDPDGGIFGLIIFQHFTINAMVASRMSAVPLIFQRDGFRLGHSRSATVAGDVLGFNVSIVARRTM